MRRLLFALVSLALACSTQPGHSSTGGGGNGGGSSCPEGTGCAAPGGDDGLCCGGQCVDFTSDPLNCGACQSPCPASATCQGGACVVTSCTGASSVLACLESDGVSLGNCCNGACLDPSDLEGD
ncbi:MAG TPA: hypothetical protein VMB50_12685, partial [Myxococcales bacterium]|nr:hypothetical protein [Myxococcales bacterium]